MERFSVYDHTLKKYEPKSHYAFQFAPANLFPLFVLFERHE